MGLKDEVKGMLGMVRTKIFCVTAGHGVYIGKHCVIGANSVVTKDIEDNVIAVGNPCKILRKITEKDKIYWNKKKEEYFQD